MQSHDTARIPLQARDGSVRAYAIVDAADADWLNQWRWSLNGRGYARRCQRINGRTVGILLHRELLGLNYGDGLEGDHIDRDTLNNRRANLRVATHPQNCQNVTSSSRTSRYRGVSWNKMANKWRVQIMLNKKHVHVGYFADQDEAGAAASEARNRLMTHAVESV